MACSCVDGDTGLFWSIWDSVLLGASVAPQPFTAALFWRFTPPSLFSLHLRLRVYVRRCYCSLRFGGATMMTMQRHWGDDDDDAFSFTILLLFIMLFMFTTCLYPVQLVGGFNGTPCRIIHHDAIFTHNGCSISD